jgi:hypothetical protein
LAEVLAAAHFSFNGIIGDVDINLVGASVRYARVVKSYQGVGGGFSGNTACGR